MTTLLARRVGRRPPRGRGRRLRGALAALLFASCGYAGGARADVLEAVRLDEANLARLQPRGADATAGIGDWALSNGVLCAAVSDPAHESDLSPSGGALVDLSHCGVADDQLVVVQPLTNLSQGGWLDGRSVRTEHVAGEARVVVASERDGLALETVFSLDLVEPTRLRIRSKLERRAPGARVFALGDIVLHTEKAVRPFAVDLAGQRLLQGFVHPPLDLGSLLSVARATGRADALVLVGADALEPGIAYGIRVVDARLERPGEAPEPLVALSLSAEQFTGFAVFTAPFWLGPPDTLGLLTGAQTMLMDLAEGDVVVIEREIRVGGRSDVASALDPMLAALAPQSYTVSGRVFDPGARVHVHAEGGGAVTQARPDEWGDFRFRLPPGRYRLDALAPGGRSAEQPFAVEGEDVDVGDLALPPAGRLALPRGAAMRLVFHGEGGTPDPVFGDDLLGVRFGDDPAPTAVQTNELSLSGTPADPEAVSLRPGRYRVLATRGPEHAVTQARVRVEAAQTVALEVVPPPRVLDTPGWISADLHVHAAPSDDTALPLRARLASYVAQGAEVLVATDHDHVTDYGPLVRELGLASTIATVVGQEVTSNVKTAAAPHTIGHANVFPLPFRPAEYRKGAIPNEGRRLRDVIAEVRALGGARLVQLNHPRAERERLHAQAFFSHLGVAGEPFDPRLPLGELPNAHLLEPDPGTGFRDLDFDAIELLNGPHPERYLRVRDDWFSLLRQGIVRTATANSDSHQLAEPAAAPSSYVRVAGDAPDRFDEAEFVDAVRGGRLVGTTGPLVVATLGGVGVGERFIGAAARLRVQVQAAPWVPVDRLRVYVDGREVRSAPLVPKAAEGADPATSAHTALYETALTFEGDAFVTVEVEGAAAPGSIYAEVLPRFTPFAFTNPILVDADADGTWSAPGL